MKIKDIVHEAATQAVITNFQPGKSVEVSMPDGTQIKKDLIKDPGAIAKDQQGNPVFNLAGSAQGTSGLSTQQKPITTGTAVTVNTDPTAKFTAETQEEDDTIESEKNQDIGGDPTDEFIDDVVDHSWERSSRSYNMNGKVSGSRGILPENDELSKWLTIAGLR